MKAELSFVGDERFFWEICLGEWYAVDIPLFERPASRDGGEGYLSHIFKGAMHDVRVN